MSDAPVPDSKLFSGYTRWLKTQGKAPRTIENYLYELKNIPHDVESYFANQQLAGAKMKYAAYRSYLKFLAKKKLLPREDLMDALEAFVPPKKRGNGKSDRKFSIPRDQWVDYIRKAPNQIAKFGIWLGFNFGLRLGEILHLRTDDIDDKNLIIRIRPHKTAKTKNQKAWQPKYNRERDVPFTKDQWAILKRWIANRPSEVKHPYLLWTPNKRGGPLNRQVHERTFQNWCRVTGLHPHVLRYSFATHYYNESKDVKLISDLLGHSSVAITSEYLCLGQKETMSKARALFASS